MLNGLNGETEVEAVLGRYPGLAARRATPQGGGFSGARVFRVAGLPGDFALRFWPVERTAAEVAHIHRLMAEARRRLSFVPALLPCDTGQTFLEWRGGLVEVTTWMPGTADGAAPPAPQRVTAACRALARLHGVWEGGYGRAVCPGVRRRLEALETWRRVGSVVGVTPRSKQAALLAEASRLIERWFTAAAGALERWTREMVDVQPCLCDIWRAHVLFTEDAVTGLIDFGSVKEDGVAGDLARLLGSLAEEDEALWRVGLDAYGRERPLAPKEWEMARALDRTGVVVALTHWLRWLGLGERRFADEAAAFRRLESLVARVGKWTLFGPLEVE
ncbi:MAG: phosphotransferase [Gemmataceae bacterium]